MKVGLKYLNNGDKEEKPEISFSILMANYNNSKYIEVAVNSVLNQTYPYWELVIVDDNSSDDSLNVIKQYLTQENIKLIRHDKNLGYGGSLKTAAANATKDVLCILDPDDKLDEKALEILADAYSKYPEYGFIYSNLWICDSNLENCIIAKSGPRNPNDSTIFNHVVYHLKSFRKEVYDKTIGYEISQKRTVDKDIIYKLEEVTDFKYINKPLYYYRKHSGGISQYKNVTEAFLYHYIAKLKTYRRRLNTDLPNFTKYDLITDYIIITFKSITEFRKTIYRFFRINLLLYKIQKRFPKLTSKFQNRFKKESAKKLLRSLL